MRICFVSLLAVLSAFGWRSASAATCTVTRVEVLIPNLTLFPDLPTLNGYQIPAAVDEAAGTVSFDLTSVPQATFDLFSVISNLLPSGGSYTGTLDASGAITVPDVNVHFVTNPNSPQEFTTITTATLTTGISSDALQMRDYPSFGSNLDFATGSLTIAGTGIVTNAQGANGSVVAGMSIACTLAPIPDRSKLPAGLSLQKVSVKGKFGKAKKNVTVPGDSLMVKGMLTQGATAVDPQTNDVFLRIPGEPGADMDFLLVRIPANTLQAKGKTLAVTDTDGTMIHVVEGQKQIGNDVAAIGGKLQLHYGKKSILFTLKETGLDLCKAPTAASTLTVSLGTTGVSTAVTVKRAGKSTCK